MKLESADATGRSGERQSSRRDRPLVVVTSWWGLTPARAISVRNRGTNNQFSLADGAMKNAISHQ